MNNFPAFLYVLEDPREAGHIRYVGRTQSLPQRLVTHNQRMNRQDPHPLYQWFRDLKSEGIEPTMRVLWQGSLDESYEAEKKAIEGYKQLGFSLLNRSEGGLFASGWKATPQARAKMSAFQKGRKKPSGFGQKISKALKGVPKSAAHRQQIRESRRSPEVRQFFRELWTPERKAQHAEKIRLSWEKRKQCKTLSVI